MEIVIVGWGDAHSEFDHNEFTGKPMEGETVGFFVEVNPEAIVVCGTNYEDGEMTKYSTIPLGMVRFVRFAPAARKWRNSHTIKVNHKVVWKGK